MRFSKGSFLSLTLFFITTVAFAQKKSFDCSVLKNGTYYMYPTNSTEQYKLVRNGDIQVEYNLAKNDSTVFKIKWNRDCSYSLDYLSSGSKMNPGELEILKNRKLVQEILDITPDYYIVSTYLDKIVNTSSEYRQLVTDTVWNKNQPGVRNSELFKAMTEKEIRANKRLKDTSGYAILYLYRPGRFMAAGNEYYVHCNKRLIFWAQNTAKVACKILKEGPLTLYAKTGGVESAVTLDIKFGKKYYVQCIIHHKVYYVTPELKIMENERGELDFESGQ